MQTEKALLSFCKAQFPKKADPTASEVPVRMIIGDIATEEMSLGRTQTRRSLKGRSSPDNIFSL